VIFVIVSSIACTYYLRCQNAGFMPKPSWSSSSRSTFALFLIASWLLGTRVGVDRLAGLSYMMTQRLRFIKNDTGGLKLYYGPRSWDAVECSARLAGRRGPGYPRPE
jgi:hypothetical protein